MKKIGAAFLVLSGVAFSANDPLPVSFENEVTLSYSSAHILNFSGLTETSLNLDYALTFLENWQWNIRPSFTYYNMEGDSWGRYGLFTGATYNLRINGRLQDAFFLTAGLGMDVYFGNEGYHTTYAQAELGKRFELIPGLAYRPTNSFKQPLQGKSDGTVQLTPLAFSLQF